jgi:outer membrane protein
MCRNHFKHFVLILAVLNAAFVSTASAQRGSSLTLQQCIELAWENNLQLRQQKLSVDLAGENLSQSRANMFPSLNASASHGYNFGRTVDPFTNEFASERVQSNNFSVSGGMNLFSGFQVRNSIRQYGYELAASKKDLERSYNDVALLVASGYLQILFTMELVTNVLNQIEITRLQLERTQRMVSAGSLARGAALTIQAQLATEELQLVNAQNQLELSYLTLKQIMYLPHDADFSIVIPQIEVEDETANQATPLEVFSVAVQEQPQIQASELRVLSAERALAVARGSRSPMLSVRGSVGTGYSSARIEVVDFILLDPARIGLTASGEEVFGPSFRYITRTKPFSNQVNDNFNQSIGLFLSVPIFNNYQVKAAIGRSRIGLESARLQNDATREQLFQTIQQAHADASAALKRYYATQKNVLALQESFRYSEQRFEVGMMNTVEYNDAKNRLSTAESELLQSKYEYIFRMKILEFYLGQPLSL